MTVAIYARYSADRQRESSIDDQVRNCMRHAQRLGFEIQRTYSDRALSGSVSARPGYREMVSHAMTGDLTTLMVDDLSRLSRDDHEMRGLLKRLAWKGVRVIGVSDGYDSDQRGHKIHAGFKGLMNELFLDDLRERTHRGMTGQALKGYNCGGRTFGYRNVPIEDDRKTDPHGRPSIVAVRYEIHEQQADVVRRIYERYAKGGSYRDIASSLNMDEVPSSRGKKWAVSGVKSILDNPMYEGTLIWNRRIWSRHPETGKRVYKVRPREEWIVKQKPDLRIVDGDTAKRVRERKSGNKANYKKRLVYSNSQRYLLSGLMRCEECGGNFVIAGQGRYGCASYRTRGRTACSNKITVSRHIVEDRILACIKARLLTDRSVDTFKRAVTSIVKAQRDSTRSASLRRELGLAENAVTNIVDAISRGIVTDSTKDALLSAEARAKQLRGQLSEQASWDAKGLIAKVVDRYEEAVREFESRIQGSIEPARAIIYSLLGDYIQIRVRGEKLQAVIPSSVPVILSKSLNQNSDWSGCGGLQGCEPDIVCLKATPRDSTPLKHRKPRSTRTTQTSTKR